MGYTAREVSLKSDQDGIEIKIWYRKFPDVFWLKSDQDGIEIQKKLWKIWTNLR
jgi:hypothetical protein